MKDINQYCVVQHKNYAIGNFIMCTPAIRAVSSICDTKVNVFFSDPVVRDMFLDCPFINIIKSPRKQLFSSASIIQKPHAHKNLELGDYDWKWLYEHALRKIGAKPEGPCPHTYVDACSKPEEIPFTEYVVIIRGANHQQARDFHQRKDPGPNIYSRILSTITDPIVFIGNKMDEAKYIKPLCPHGQKSVKIIGDIRKSLGAINYAKRVIANDTGMYHAARALKKEIFVMWKKTPFAKNSYPDTNITYSRGGGSWWKDYKKWAL